MVSFADVNLPTLGDRIKELRETRRMSKGALAKTLRVSTTAVRRWEQDRGDPLFSRVAKMAEVFDLTLSEFLRGVNA